jgi:hypothetical protein
VFDTQGIYQLEHVQISLSKDKVVIGGGSNLSQLRHMKLRSLSG